MVRSHVTFACTSAPQPLLRADALRAALAPGPARMLVDIAVPRNFEDLGHSAPLRVRAYNVDDLQALASANQARRRGLMRVVERILAHELQAFRAWQARPRPAPAGMALLFESLISAVCLEEIRRVEKGSRLLRRCAAHGSADRARRLGAHARAGCRSRSRQRR
jgi:glutamyl-tRNA reductase